MGLRDIGPIYRADATRPILAVSPDGKVAAFELHQGNFLTNGYCSAVVVIPVRKGAKPIIVDFSDELILDRSPAFNWAAFETGVSAPVTPHWAPDGRSLAYLKRVRGSTQVWVANSVTGDPRQLTHSKADVEDLRITDDGRTVLYAARSDLSDQIAAIDQEGRRGWRADARLLPLRGPRPQTPTVPRRYFAIDVANGTMREASEAEVAQFARPTGVPSEATAFAASRGQLAWIEPQSGSRIPAPHDLIVQSAKGERKVCSAAVCGAGPLSRLWWTADGGRLRFTRREGWADSLTGVYEWAPEMKAPRRLLLTPDALTDCAPLGHDLLCLRESSTQPRRLVTLGLANDRPRLIFDPNIEFSALALGRVERLQWRNPSGVAFYGDLVYPVGYPGNGRRPLVVVQYRSKGFLRGGTGDEVAIQALANRGYFVLVADIRDAEAIVGDQESAAALQKAYEHEMAGVRGVLAGIESQVTALIERGLVDRDRIGISGLSAGSLTVQFAAKHSLLFAAGSLSGCCLDPMQDAFLGPMIAGQYHEVGWPKMADGDAAIWKQVSLWSEPQKVRFPLLFQAADNEYLAAAPSYTALRQAGVPTDLYIFPDEFHLKRQPAHQLSVYKRNRAWFDFWLRGILPADETEREEALRWQEMRKVWKPSVPGKRAAAAERSEGH
ncbi:Atxe2 family lasso peptide isopeptidase [Novosphingobium kaempferiae]|uniref:Atxe2 family lasso peptide isopeptidase n=1 Tax=Novosphingobium kaempferiae TaxID=2896849 RepID=UPI001E451BCC|nr:Atxe2 family lasso peptide isopeptidase [Novosphingobium kaempferiae]